MARISQHHIPHGEYHGVVIVGAGMAGMAAAHALLEEGVTALTLEAEDHVGGRCATVQFNGGVFDVGAQYFTVRRPEFKPLTDYWARRNATRVWSQGFPDISGVSELAGHPRYHGVGGMGKLVELLAARTPPRLNARVKRLVEGRGCWLIEVEGQKRIKADMVVLTPPLPTALRLISDENTWRMGALLMPLTGIEYLPVLAVAATLDSPSGLPDPGAAHVDSPVVSWIADNQMKGVSPDSPAVTIHVTRAFTNANKDASLEETGALVTRAAAPFLNGRIVAYHTYLWPHGAPLNTLTKPWYCAEGRAPLYFAGDAFGGGLVEGAAISGMAVGRAIAERLKMKTARA